MLIKFDSLWDTLSRNLIVEEKKVSENPNYIIRIPNGGISIKVGSSKNTEDVSYANIVCISRHFVKKPLYNIELTNKNGKKFRVCTTADHTCISSNHIDKDFNNTSAKDVKVGDVMIVSECDKSFYATISSIDVINSDNGVWVYDLEVDTSEHLFFANGVLVHNSQFMNLSPITKTKCKEFGIDTSTIFSELPDNVKDSIIKTAYNILDRINANVEKIVNADCHTTHGNVLHYSLEYIAAEGFYFAKKCYIVHKIIEDDRPCNKFKYSGISVKKAEIPSVMKTYLKDIYESTMTKPWTEHNYIQVVNEAYHKFLALPWEDISFYKKYRTAKQALSLTESEKGSLACVRGVNIYNGMLKEFDIGGKYPSIGLGDEYRYSYVIPSNSYGIDVISFKGVFPNEFKKEFKIDYDKMFDRIFTASLKKYVSIMNYKTHDPSHATEDPTFSLF